MKNVKIHFINEENDKIVAMPVAFHVPNVGDEIRLGGEGNEQYYRVTRRVFIYDEETIVEIDRVNIGVTKSI
jgi:hypothetical protein